MSAGRVPVKIGCRMEMSVATYDELAEQAQAAERVGFDTVWIRDHVSIEPEVATPLSLECWTSMTALARDTSRIRIGSQMLCNGWRNAALLAKMASTLDVISKGRLVMGLGAGFLEREWKEYGYAFPPAPDRIRGLAETIRIMRGMWSQPETTYDGRYHSVYKAVNEPKGVQPAGPPVVIGASGEKLALRNVAELADGWNTNEAMPSWIHKREVLDRYCEELHRDPTEIAKYVGIYLVLDRDEVRANRRADDLAEAMVHVARRRKTMFVGSAEQFLEHIRPYVVAGCRNFVTYFMEPGLHVQNIAAFGEQVIPLLGQLGSYVSRPAMISPYQAVVLQPRVQEVSDPDTAREVARNNIWQQVLLLRRFKFSYPSLRLVVLSELATHGLEASGSREKQRKLALPLPLGRPLWEVKGAEEVAMYAYAAREFNIYISGAGLFLDDISPDPFLTGFVISPEGKVILAQRMIGGGLNYVSTVSLYSKLAEAYGEDGPFSPFAVADTEIGRLGMCVGGDHIQMETCRMLGMRGTEVIIHHMGERNWWMNRARFAYKRIAAFDNQCYMVASNIAQYIHNDYRAPAPPNSEAAAHLKNAMNWAEFEFMGQSSIIAPDGQVLAFIPGSGESATGAVIDIEGLRQRRRSQASGPRLAWGRAVHGEAFGREYGVFPGPGIDWEGDGKTALTRDAGRLQGLLETGTLARSEGYGGVAGGGHWGAYPSQTQTKG